MSEISETKIASSRPRPRLWKNWSRVRDWDRDFFILVSCLRLRPRLFYFGLVFETETETFLLWSGGRDWDRDFLNMVSSLRRRPNQDFSNGKRKKVSSNFKLWLWLEQLKKVLKKTLNCKISLDLIFLWIEFFSKKNCEMHYWGEGLLFLN